MQKMIALDDLHPGDEAKTPINVRKVGREEDVATLSASIDSHGLGQALNVRETDGKHGRGFYVEDGNRRLLALRLLKKKGNVTGKTLVMCEISEKEGLVAGELGLALNIERVPMHEADQYEKFWDLHETHKQTIPQIASRFGIDKKVVAKALALGKLSPLILDGWRDNKLRQAEEVVKAFTLAPTIKDQEDVFKRLKKSGDLFPYRIREAFGAGNQVAAQNLKFVGRKDFEAVGGKIIEDLFEDTHIPSDPALLAKLARTKLEGERDKLKAAGWSWAAVGEDLTGDWRYGWARHGAGASKKKYGAIVLVGRDGKLETLLGVEEPSKAKATPATKAAPKAGAVPPPSQPADLSHPLQRDLDAMAYKATKEALQKEKPASPLAGILAEVVAKQIVVGNGNGYMPEAVKQALKRIRNEISPDVMKAALDHHFEADRYFKSAPKSFVLKAIKEAVSPEQAKKLEKGTKAAAWKFALTNVPKTGWLPPELRTAHYAGPGAKAEPKPKATPLKKAA